jgi:hypothetical protein
VREEELTRQIDARLSLIALSEANAQWLTQQFDHARHDETAAHADQLQSLRHTIAAVDAKLTRLTTAYSEGVLELDEFRPAKAKLVEEKAAMRARSDRIAKDPLVWLEPAERFLNLLSEATLALSSHEPAEKSRFIKKTGSNLTIQNKTLQVEFSGPLKIVEKHGRFAQAETRAAVTAARAVGETDDVSHVAERKGFEPLVPCDTQSFQDCRLNRSRTSPPLQFYHTFIFSLRNL